MDISRFRSAFWSAFGACRNRPSDELLIREVHDAMDLCPDVPGMLSLKKQQLLRLAFALLPEDEAYMEVGTYMGKSLVSAMMGNARRTVYAVDNFSEFEGNTFQVLKGHLEDYGLYEQVQFWNGDFRSVLRENAVDTPVGLYFYDGGHDFDCQYQAIKLAEPFLADEALVLVDDWRYALDSGSHAREATLQAMSESEDSWRLLYELPARFNGDLGMWWNGVGVLAYKRACVADFAMV